MVSGTLTQRLSVDKTLDANAVGRASGFREWQPRERIGRRWKCRAGNVTGFNRTMQTILLITALGVATLALIRLAIAATDPAWPAERIARFDGCTGNNARRVMQPESTFGSNAAPYGRKSLVFTYMMRLASFERSTGTPENVTGSGGGPWGQVWTERPRVGVSAYFAARNAGSNPARLN